MRAAKTFTVPEHILTSSKATGATYILLQLRQADPDPIDVALLGAIAECLDQAGASIADQLIRNLRAIVGYDDIIAARLAMADVGQILSGHCSLDLSATLYHRGEILGKIGGFGSLKIH